MAETTKKRIIVAIAENTHTGWKSRLPPVVEADGYEIIITHDVRAISHQGEVLKNFDLLIDHTTFGESAVPETRRLVSPDDVIEIDRLMKSEQSTMNLMTVTVSGDGSVYHQLLQCRYVVAKPMSGARSMGIFLIDTERVSLNSFFGRYGLMRPWERNSVCEGDSAHSSASARLDEFLALWGDAVKFCHGEEHWPGEAISMLPTSISGFHLSAYIEPADGDEQYRIIIDGQGRVISCQKRVLADHWLRYPANNFIEPEAIYPMALMTNLDHLEDDPRYMFNAVDILVRKDDSFYVFEHSPEFGIDAMAPNHAAYVMRTLLVSAVKLWLKRKET